MRVAVIGSRGFKDYDKLETVLDQLAITLIVSGGADGADILGERYANDNNIDTLIFKADWKKHGKSAGYIRNVDIIENADIVIAFWDGESKGTKHSIDLSHKKKKAIRIIRCNDEK